MSQIAERLARVERRLEATKARMAQRIQSAEEAVRRAEAALQAAQDRLARARAKVQTVKDQAGNLIDKQAAEVEQVRERAAQAKAAPPAGTVETGDGRTLPVSREAVETIANIIGRRRKGLLSPLEGEEAQTVLTALEKAAGGNIGETFTLTIRGRLTLLRFGVEEAGLSFVAVPRVAVVAP